MRSRILHEGDGRLADLERPFDLEERHRAALAEPSAAAAKRRSDFTWLRRKMAATASSTSDEPTIHMTKI